MTPSPIRHVSRRRALPPARYEGGLGRRDVDRSGRHGLAGANGSKQKAPPSACSRAKWRPDAGTPAFRAIHGDVAPSNLDDLRVFGGPGHPSWPPDPRRGMTFHGTFRTSRRVTWVGPPCSTRPDLRVGTSVPFVAMELGTTAAIGLGLGLGHPGRLPFFSTSPPATWTAMESCGINGFDCCFRAFHHRRGHQRRKKEAPEAPSLLRI